ncbi:unnamed protein product [Cutaneotrichosporon oleaginosum]
MRICPWVYALFLSPAWAMDAWDASRRAALREEVRDMFHHAFTGYMTFAYPADELRPISCAPLHRDPNPANIGINDIHANISMTLVDALSALPLILPDEYPAAVERVARISFDQNVKVQVFEMTIRALGALLSTYQRLDALPEDPRAQAEALGIEGTTDIKKYAPRMLELAWDLGKRLLPAFDTPTGLPYARVNLRQGVESRESAETCTAGAGSLVLEFTLLSRLTGDERFEDLAHRAFMALWNRRTAEDLVGNAISVNHGQWLQPGMSGTNAGIDSFFEYALKGAIMLDDPTYMDVFHDAYAAIQTHVRTKDGFIYRPVQLRSLRPASTSVIDSLSAFFPGVQVLAGDIESAIRNHLIFWNIWRRYSGIPESWAHDERVVGWAGWPGRPEFIESTYYLYTVTRDDFYLRVGERVLRDIRRRTITPCGFATLANVETGETEDRMESFLLSETLKYLYLLFADLPSAPPSNTVFTTEGHQLHLPRNLTRSPTATRRALHKREDLYCPAYVPQTLGGLPVGIEGRDDYEYARALVYGPGKEGLRVAEGRTYDGLGTCTIPEVPRFAFEIVLTPSNVDPEAPLPAHDAAPSATKVWQKNDGDWVIADIEGLRLGCRWRFDRGGYDVTNIGPHRVRYGQHIFITDPKMEGYLPSLPPEAPKEDAQDVVLQIRHAGKEEVVIRLQTSTSDFGRAFLPSSVPAEPDSEDQHPFSAEVPLDAPLFVVVPKNTLNGCAAVQEKRLDPKPKGPFALFVARGGCTFADKARNAVRAGASMLLVGDNEAGGRHVRPTAVDEPASFMEEVAGLRVGFVGHDEAMILATLHNAAPLEVLLEGPLAQREGTAVPLPQRREGKLVVGEHDLVNIRVVEA